MPKASFGDNAIFLLKRKDLEALLWPLRNKYLVCDCTDPAHCWALLLQVTFCETFGMDPSNVYIPVVASPDVVDEPWDDSELNVQCMLHDRPVRPHSDSSGKQAARHRGPQLVPDGLKENEHLRVALALQHPYLVNDPSTYAVNLALSGERMSTEALTAWSAEVLRVLAILAESVLCDNNDMLNAAPQTVSAVLRAYQVKNAAFMRELTFV